MISANIWAKARFLKCLGASAAGTLHSLYESVSVRLHQPFLVLMCVCSKRQTRKTVCFVCCSFAFVCSPVVRGPWSLFFCGCLHTADNVLSLLLLRPDKSWLWQFMIALISHVVLITWPTEMAKFVWCLFFFFLPILHKANHQCKKQWKVQKSGPPLCHISSRNTAEAGW